MKNFKSLASRITPLGFMLACSVALALDDRVESLQQPAWVNGSGERSAAFPGQMLQQGDHVTTGDSGKIWLNLAEGSRVKLGNNASMKLDIRGVSSASTRTATDTANTGDNNRREESVYEAALDVLKGAFRFTTTELGKRLQRNLTIQAGPVATIGIRGTDVWGRVDAQSSFVALIEGNIAITRYDGSTLSLDRPLTVFQASTQDRRGGTQQVNLSDVQKLAPETELDGGQGVLVEDGPYSVHLLSLRSRAAAEASKLALRKNGYAASQSSATVGSETWHRVSINGFASLEDAQSFSQQALTRELSESPWVANNR